VARCSFLLTPISFCKGSKEVWPPKATSDKQRMEHYSSPAIHPGDVEVDLPRLAGRGRYSRGRLFKWQFPVRLRHITWRKRVSGLSASACGGVVAGTLSGNSEYSPTKAGRTAGSSGGQRVFTIPLSSATEETQTPEDVAVCGWPEHCNLSEYMIIKTFCVIKI